MKAEGKVHNRALSLVNTGRMRMAESNRTRANGLHKVFAMTRGKVCVWGENDLDEAIHFELKYIYRLMIGLGHSTIVFKASSSTNSNLGWRTTAVAA